MAVRLTAIAIFLIFITANATAQDLAAPFGLEWGMSRAETLKLGVQIEQEERRVEGIYAAVTNLPQVLADTESVLLYYGFDDELSRITSISKKWRRDKRGTNIRSRFQELRALLTQKYGPPGRNIDIVPRSRFYQRDENFAYSISQNERMHVARWDNDYLEIVLGMAAQHEDTYYMLSYDFKPLAGKAERALEQQEEGAL
jgi:hypothetical protein